MSVNKKSKKKKKSVFKASAPNFPAAEDSFRESGGYVLLNPAFQHWPGYKNVDAKMLMIHCLLSAHETDKAWKGLVVRRGTFISSAATLAQEIGFTQKQLSQAVKDLEALGELSVAPAGPNTTCNVYVVRNYDQWLGPKSQSGTGLPLNLAS